MSRSPVCAIKAPRFGENRKANLQDLVILTAGENEDHLNDKAKQEVTTEEDGDKNTEERESENNANIHEKSTSGEDKQSVAEKSASGEGKQSLSEKGEKAVGKEVKAARSQKGDSAKHEVIDKELLQVDDLRSDDDPNVFLVNNFQDPLQVCYCSFL
ncbi:hypothetical protein E2562_012211 [Oryza meyeriana var. granulata]|uniref:Uncharacterized protein n=1 Tax=Oryza meyeriana var. granulata TaxID=110450 RepID=A0A6G1D1R1_9ORYZ|nr:hypothetical protein E2562_012211 [Oryza meyeriana var. granulata]KAF0906629.1 hypothetical protein E2562_012211 [Oryza meyeriana var. granulata]